MGLRLDDLGTPVLTWTDVRSVVVCRPLGSALSRSMDGEEALWGLPEQLLAAIADRLAQMLWQNGGGKGPRPKPIPRPGTQAKPAALSNRKFDVMTVEQFESRYAERQRRQN